MKLRIEIQQVGYSLYRAKKISKNTCQIIANSIEVFLDKMNKIFMASEKAKHIILID